MHLTGPAPTLSPENARAIARLLIRQAEAEKAESTGPEPIGDIAPKATAEIIGRGKGEDSRQ